MIFLKTLPLKYLWILFYKFIYRIIVQTPRLFKWSVHTIRTAFKFSKFDTIFLPWTFYFLDTFIIYDRIHDITRKFSSSTIIFYISQIFSYVIFKIKANKMVFIEFRKFTSCLIVIDHAYFAVSFISHCIHR